jgi:hypothetical protein
VLGERLAQECVRARLLAQRLPAERMLNTTTPIERVAGSCFKARHKARPSSFGTSTSVMTTSGRSSRARSRAACPSVANSTPYPASWRK